MTSVWLNINRNGRLGNRLFTRAHVYAAARERGAIVVDWGLTDVMHFFPKIRHDMLPVYPLCEDGSTPPVPNFPWLKLWAIKALRTLRPRRTGHLGPYWSCYWGHKDPDLMRLDGDAFSRFVADRQMIVLDGYKLRCTPWVNKYASEIRAYFAFSKSIQSKWTHLQESWHTRWRHTIGVHLRATDFRKAQGGRFYLSPHEYASILRNQPSLSSEETLFVLFSDESYADDNAYSELSRNFFGLHHIFCHGDLIDDLAGLASCDRIVGPETSTYSRWAAFMGCRPWAPVTRVLVGQESPLLQFRDCVVPWDY